MILVRIAWHRRPSTPAADRLRSVVREVLAARGVPAGEVHVVITGDETVRELNRSYRGIDRPTDVLSFPDGSFVPDAPQLLGEVILSLDAARRQGRDAGHGEVRELELLLLHGVLHLTGMDHETDGGAMRSVEHRLQKELFG